MGILIQTWKTIPLPAGVKVGRDRTVTWIAKGKKRTGKLSGTGKVNVKVDTWTAQYTDETGKVQRVSTKTTIVIGLGSVFTPPRRAEGNVGKWVKRHYQNLTERIHIRSFLPMATGRDFVNPPKKYRRETNQIFAFMNVLQGKNCILSPFAVCEQDIRHFPKNRHFRKILPKLFRSGRSI